MKLPDLLYGWRKMKRDTLAIRGINYSDQIADGDLADSAGLSTRRYPYFSTLHGRPAVDGYANVTAVYRYSGAGRDNILTVVETENSAMLCCDGTELHPVIPGEKRQFVTINTKIVVWPDKLMLDMTTDPPTVRDMDASFDTVGSDTVMTGNSLTIPNVPLSDRQCLPTGFPYAQVKTGYWFQVYSGLAWNGSAYTYTDVDWKEIGGAGQAGDTYQLKPGDVLIPVLASADATTMRAQVHAVSSGYIDPPSQAADDRTHGFGYYLQVKEINGYVKTYPHLGERLLMEVSVTYNVFQFGEENPKITKVFRAGDAMSISGHPLSVNNKEVVVTTEVTDEKLTFPDNTFVPCIGYAELTAADVAVEYVTELANVPSSGKFLRVSDANAPYDILKKDGTHITREAGQIIAYSAGETPTAWLITPDEKVYEIQSSVQTGGSSGAATPEVESVGDLHLTITRAMPDMDYICEKDNRLWGVVNHQDNRVWDADTHKWKTFESRLIVASSLGMPDDFYDYNGAYSGAYAVAVASEGDFTGIAPYGDAVLAWKEKRLCKVLGDYPANYSMHEYTVDGLQAGAHGTQVNISETLIYKGVNGVYAYGGGTPRLISAQFGEHRYTAEAAGTDGERYYITLHDADGNHHLHSYDVQRGIWLRESDDNAVGYIDLPAGFSALLSDGTLHRMDNGADDPELAWYAQFTPLYETMDGKKRYAKLLLRLELGTNAHVRIMERVDGSPWQQIGRIAGKPRNVVTVPVPVARGGRMEFRLEGVGACTILGIQRQFFVGSDV